MKYCKHCGTKLEDKEIICFNCGKSIATTTYSSDEPSGWFAVIGFLLPIIGLILYLTHKDTHPMKAHSAGKWALISFIISIILSMIGSCSLLGLLGGMY